jgi:hypothetical protein
MSDAIERAAYPEDVMKAAREAAALAYESEGETPSAWNVRDGLCDDDCMVEAAARAIRTERERCATVAEEYDTGGFGEHRNMVTAQTVSSDIAAAIRKGKSA